MDIFKRFMGAVGKRFRLRSKQFGTYLRKIHLVDKCLLILMAVLLAQSAYVLMTNNGEGATANHVDVIVRTSAASIFGYFLSANFVQRGITEQEETRVIRPSRELLTQSAREGSTPQNRIGFSLPEGEAKVEGGLVHLQEEAPMEEVVTSVTSRLQIITATGIAVFCLTALILVRNVAGGETQINSSTAAVMAQFRDFVSGCVGFLIGCPTVKGNGK